MPPLRFIAASVGRRTFRFPWITPPIGIMSLTAMVRERFDAQVRIVNQRLFNITNEALVKDIADFSPDIIALSAFTPHKNSLIDVCAMLKTVLPNALILVGGPHTAAVGVRVLSETQADIAVSSEGEVALEMIINQYLSDKAWDTIPGLFWRDKNNDIIENPGKIDLIQDLDSLPFPAYDLIDLPAYWRLQYLPPETYSRYVTLVTSRGCPYGCKWCHNIFGRNFRAQSAQRIIEEILYYKKTYGVKDFDVQDDIFNLDHDRLIEFCNLVHKHDLKIRLCFPNGLRTDILRESEIDALVSIGAHFSAFALETGSPRLQEAMGKRLDIGRFLHNVEYATSKGIFGQGYIMLGFPTETEEEMMTTIDVACSSALHMASFYNVIPFPNTEIYKMALRTHEDKIRNYDYTSYTYTSSRLNISAVPDDTLWHIQREAYRRFYSIKRIYRVMRDSTARYQYLTYIPHFIDRVFKGTFK